MKRGLVNGKGKMRGYQLIGFRSSRFPRVLYQIDFLKS